MSVNEFPTDGWKTKTEKKKWKGNNSQASKAGGRQPDKIISETDQSANKQTDGQTNRKEQKS